MATALADAAVKIEDVDHSCSQARNSNAHNDTIVVVEWPYLKSIVEKAKVHSRFGDNRPFFY